MNMWTQAEAIKLCRKLEAICPLYGCHVGLTGGCLYKESFRKDLDIIFYRSKSMEEMYPVALIEALGRNFNLKIIRQVSTGLWKADYCGKKLDIFIMERLGDEDYESEESEA